MFGKKRDLNEEFEDTQFSDGLDYDSEVPAEETPYPEDIYYTDEEPAGAEDAYGEYSGEYGEGYDYDGDYDGAYDENYDGEYDEYDDDYEDEYEDDYDEPRQKSLGRTVAYTLTVLVISSVLAVLMWFAADDVLALTKPDNVITITISEGDSLDAVAQNLKDHGLVNYKFLFKLYGTFSHAEDKFGTGTFELNQQFDYHALVNGLASYSESRKTVTLTFPEGYTCSQIFQSLEENGVCARADLEDVAANYDFDYEFLADRPYGEANRLEGYMFPDTYDFYVDDEPSRVINKFLSNFAGRVTDDMLAAIDERNAAIRAAMEEEGTFSAEEIDNAMMDVYKVVTVASLIEKEAGNDQERSTIASVIYNRLTTHVHELLQIDASVEYALGEHKAELTANDLAVDNPYNTYKYKGLPPGPIANPGLASIMAALYPKETDYFFYALDSSGGHQFFETYMDQQDFLNGVEPEEDEEPEPEPSPAATETSGTIEPPTGDEAPFFQEPITGETAENTGEVTNDGP